MFNVKKIINELERKLFTVLYSRNTEFALVRLLFLKYAVDNYVGATSVENMQMCARAQKMFAMKDIENGIETIVPVLQYIDAAYGLTEVLSSIENIEGYACELFGDDKNRQKKNVFSENFKAVMDILGALDLEEKNKDNSLGEALVDALIENITANSNRNSYSSEYTTRTNLSKLAGKLLNVQSDDVFCDFASGTGLSTIEITKHAMPQIINVDINRSAIAISAMLYIMSGYHHVNISSKDSFTKKIEGLCGNKIFVDGPIASKLKKTDDNEYIDSSSAIINRVLHDYLSDSEDAMAVITLPSSPLFASKNPTLALREELVSLGLVKAVIALPPLWRGTAVGTNLLVITRKPQPKVLFINAAETPVKTVNKLDIAGETLLPEDKIDLIAATVAKPESIVGFSKVATFEEIKGKNFNLIPATYVEVKREADDITVAEIDAKLAELYAELMK